MAMATVSAMLPSFVSKWFEESAPAYAAKLKNGAYQMVDNLINYDISDENTPALKKEIKKAFDEFEKDPSIVLMKKDFKNLKKKDSTNGETKYNFNVLNENDWKEYMKIANQLSRTSNSINAQFAAAVNSVNSDIQSFISSYNKVKNEAKTPDELKKAIANITTECTKITSRIKGYFEKYLKQKKMLTTPCDFAKFYFAACSISSKKEPGIGLVGRGIINAKNQILDELLK